MAKLSKRPGLWIVLAIAVIAVVAILLGARGRKVKVALATRKDLEQHVVASGRVWVPTRVQVAAQTPGLVVAVGAIEGQHVKAGDLLVQIDDAEARAAVSQAKAAVEQANARVEQLRRVGAIVATEAVRQADTNLERAEVELGRAQKLAASGAVARVDLDNAQRAVDLARAQKTSAEAQRIASAPMGADTRIALTALLQAQAQYAGANVRLTQTRIVAHHDGVVLSRSVEQGDVVQPSRTLMILAADADLQLVFQPDERNLAWIALGQKARASADAYPQQVFDADVSYIAPSIDPQRGSVEVRLRVPSAPSFLLPDMTVSVDLTVARREKALVVPSDAVRDAATPAAWVFAVENDRLVRKNVKLGIRGEGATEIVEGVADSAVVVLSDVQPREAGQRVRTERD